jgi:REP element-mobilizing transposase RayT
VPESLIDGWKTELSRKIDLPPSDPRKAQLRKRIAKYEDAGHGSCWLRDRCIAEVVVDALLQFDGERYSLVAWCVMPNHVHAIAELKEEWPLAGLLHSWKSFTAHKANKILNRSGEFWFREYHDRYIRDEEHLRTAIEYVENNPVKACLVRVRQKWPWSSAKWEHEHQNLIAIP